MSDTSDGKQRPPKREAEAGPSCPTARDPNPYVPPPVTWRTGPRLSY
jgi:hypothetical protein